MILLPHILHPLKTVAAVERRTLSSKTCCRKAAEQFPNIFTRTLFKKVAFLGCVRRFCSRKSLSWTASADFAKESHFLGLRRPILPKKATFLDCVARFCQRKSLSWTASADFAQESHFLGLRRPILPKKATFLILENKNNLF